MAKYQIIVPEGSVLLRDTVTGQTLRLSATDGPLVIGAAELTLMAGFGGASTEQDKAGKGEEKDEATGKAEAIEPRGAVAPIEGTAEDASSEVPEKKSQSAKNGINDGEALSPETIARIAATARPSHTATNLPDEVMAALDRLSHVPPGFGEETEEPFLSNIANLIPGTQVSQNAQKEQLSMTTALPPERTLEAPLEALTQTDFEATLTSLGHSRDNVEQELGFLREIESEPEDIRELEALDEALEKRYAAVSERFKSWQRLQKKIDEERGIASEDSQ